MTEPTLIRSSGAPKSKPPVELDQSLSLLRTRVQLRDNPATYTASIIEKFVELSQSMDGPILDPFAGSGGIHQIGRDDTIGIELEPEWAGHHPRTSVGDATNLPFADGSMGAVFTSPAYGNRFADSYAGEMCKACLGYGKRLLGWDTDRSHPAALYAPDEVCPECEGTKIKASRRFSYRIALGRDLTEGSGASLHWGPEYRLLHDHALQEINRVIRPGGFFVLNIKDHIRQKKRCFVTSWWVHSAQRRGLAFIEGHTVDTPGMRMGQNYDARVDGEQVIVFRKPGGS